MRSRLRFFLAYLQKPPWDTGISPPELMEFIQTHPPGKALDIGCGTGTNVLTLYKYGWNVIGVDFTSRAIRLAKQKADQIGAEVDLRVSDATQLNFLDGPFDLILDIGCFHSLPTNKRKPYIDQISRLMADDGTFLIYFFYRKVGTIRTPGVTDEDIQYIEKILHLVSRKDGLERGSRPSTWLTLQKKTLLNNIS